MCRELSVEVLSGRKKTLHPSKSQLIVVNLLVKLEVSTAILKQDAAKMFEGESYCQWLKLKTGRECEVKQRKEVFSSIIEMVTL